MGMISFIQCLVLIAIIPSALLKAPPKIGDQRYYFRHEGDIIGPVEGLFPSEGALCLRVLDPKYRNVILRLNGVSNSKLPYELHTLSHVLALCAKEKLKFELSIFREFAKNRLDYTISKAYIGCSDLRFFDQHIATSLGIGLLDSCAVCHGLFHSAYARTVRCKTGDGYSIEYISQLSKNLNASWPAIAFKLITKGSQEMRIDPKYKTRDKLVIPAGARLAALLVGPCRLKCKTHIPVTKKGLNIWVTRLNNHFKETWGVKPSIWQICHELEKNGLLAYVEEWPPVA